MVAVSSELRLFRTIDDLDEPLTNPETFYKVSGASVLWADYEKLQKHYNLCPDVTEIGSDIASIAKIDRFLLDSTAIMSETQLSQTAANEPIPALDQTVIAFRPPRYGRAAVVQAITPRNGDVLLDVKGCGIISGRIPIDRFHNTGLISIQEALRELVMQHVIENIFSRLGVNVKGVDIYAVINLGFRVRVGNGVVEQAGAIVRRAHRRPPGNNELYDLNSDGHKTKLTIELILRRFGVTASNPRGRMRFWLDSVTKNICCSRGVRILDEYSPEQIQKVVESNNIQIPSEFDVLNVQLTRDFSLKPLSAEMVDFGHYYSTKHFTLPLANIVKNRPLNWGGAIDQSSMYWTQPDPRAQNIYNTLGISSSIAHEYEKNGLLPPPEPTGLSLFVCGLEHNIVNGNLRPSEVKQRIRDFVRECAQCGD